MIRVRVDLLVVVFQHILLISIQIELHVLVVVIVILNIVVTLGLLLVGGRVLNDRQVAHISALVGTASHIGFDLSTDPWLLLLVHSVEVLSVLS